MKNLNNNINWEVLADPAIVKEIGKSLKQIRLNKNLSQEQLSKTSGLDRTTISRMESGRAATLLTLIQVLRALDRLNILNVFIVEPEISPLNLLKIQENKRKRAYTANITINKNS